MSTSTAKVLALLAVLVAPPALGGDYTASPAGGNVGFANRDRSVGRAGRASPETTAGPVLRVRGREFVDGAGRVVVLRGINLSGDAKVPPFVPVRSPSDLDPLPALGFNVVRLVFVWEAYEPTSGVIRPTYLTMMRSVAAECWARGLYVVVDFHQDGFSRYSSHGSGDGFPAWAISPRATPRTPDNSPRCKDWAVRMWTDPACHKSFTDFYANTTGVRTRYVDMMRAVAAEMASVPGVIGYDPINEPWGDEQRELAPFYRDSASAIRSAHPSAILFVEGHITTNAGLQTKLPRPDIGNVAYAPHYYKPNVVVSHSWRGLSGSIDRAFANMRSKADEWNVPLFLGEYGVPGDAHRAADYIAYLDDRLDDSLASGAQWNYTPGWTPTLKDGWNGEDFTVLAPDGRPRPNFRFRPYPRAVAGAPVVFRYSEHEGRRSVAFTWRNRPEQGATEVYLPASLFPAGSSSISVDGPDAVARFDPVRQVLTIRSPRSETLTLRVSAR